MEKQLQRTKTRSYLSYNPSKTIINKKNIKQKPIHHQKCPSIITTTNIKPKNSDSDDDTLSSRSILSINPDEPLVNNTAHNLFILAVKQAREERRQANIRQQNKKISTIIERQILLTKKKALTIDDVDRLFEEKRLRPSAIKNDLIDLYQKSTFHIRSKLDIHQVDQFLQTTQNRLATANKKPEFSSYL